MGRPRMLCGDDAKIGVGMAEMLLLTRTVSLRGT